MSLRDYFAGKSLPSILKAILEDCKSTTDHEEPNGNNEQVAEWLVADIDGGEEFRIVAELSYRMADAMLSARDRKEGA